MLEVNPGIGRRAGNRLAMQVLFARHHVRVYRFVLRLVRDQTLAEDLVSEVFLDVWRQAGRFERFQSQRDRPVKTTKASALGQSGS